MRIAFQTLSFPEYGQEMEDLMANAETKTPGPETKVPVKT